MCLGSKSLFSVFTTATTNPANMHFFLIPSLLFVILCVQIRCPEVTGFCPTLNRWTSLLGCWLQVWIAPWKGYFTLRLPFFLSMKTKLFIIFQTKVPSSLLFYFRGSWEQIIRKTKHIFTLPLWYNKICQEAGKIKVYIQRKMQFRQTSIFL